MKVYITTDKCQINDQVNGYDVGGGSWLLVVRSGDSKSM